MMPHGVFFQGPGVLAGTLLFEEHATPLASPLILQQKKWTSVRKCAKCVFGENESDIYIFLFIFHFINKTPLKLTKKIVQKYGSTNIQT